MPITFRKRKRRIRTRKAVGKRKRARTRVTRRVARNVLRSTLETKVYHQQLTRTNTSGLDATGHLYLLNQIVTGPDENERNGNKISMFRLSIPFVIQNGGNVSVGCFVRILVIGVDAGEFAAGTPTTEEFLLDSSNQPAALTAGALADIWAPLNKKAMSVYYDKVFKLGFFNSTSSFVSAVPTIRSGKISIKLNANCTFHGTATGDARNNNLRLIFLWRNEDNATAATATYVAFHSRVFYKDI